MAQARSPRERDEARERERRNTRRSARAVTLRYSYINPRDEILGSISDSGVTLNVSMGGICFIAGCPLEIGASLVVHCPALWELPREGTIRWCRRLSNDLWRVGFLHGEY